MLTQLLGWAATILGLTSTWLLGRRHSTGWPLGITCCATWVAVNLQLHLWAGVASAGIAAGLSAWNWQRWRRADTTCQHYTGHDTTHTTTHTAGSAPH